MLYHRIVMSSLVVSVVALVCVEAHSDDAKVNTPVRSEGLRGNWELQSDDAVEFKQSLHLSTGLTGHWQQSKQTHPITLAWFVEGNELRILHYDEPRESFNYRVETLIVPYKLSGDTLTLTFNGAPTVWKRAKKADPVQPEPCGEADSSA